jgi:uncharacterized protein (TIGR02001 family)
MKKSNFYSGFGFMMVLFVIASNQVSAQEEKPKSDFNVNVDLYSNYIWRGSKYGSGPAVQPSVKFNSGFFTVGVWGSFDASGYAEADPYVSFALPMGFSVGLTDYYYPGLEYFDVTNASGSQAFELNGGFTKGGLSLAANYIINEAGGAGSAGGDSYFQAGYAFSIFNLFAGAGNGWHTADGNFALCNLGIGASKEIKLFDALAIPVNGQVIFNPDKEQLYVVVGFSF